MCYRKYPVICSALKLSQFSSYHPWQLQYGCSQLVKSSPVPTSTGHAWRGPSSVLFWMICPDIWLCSGNLSAPGKPGIGKVQKKWIRKHQKIAIVFPAGNTPSRCAAIHKHGISSNLKVILVTEATMELCRQDGGLHLQPWDGQIRHALGSPAGSLSERLFPGWSCGIKLTEMEVIV